MGIAGQDTFLTYMKIYFENNILDPLAILVVGSWLCINDPPQKK